MGDNTSVPASGEEGALLRDFVDQMPSAVYLVDRQWRFTFVNTTGTRNLSSPGEVLGKTVWEMVPTIEGTDFAVALHRTMNDRQVTKTRGFSVGRGQWFEGIAYPTEDGIAVDLTDVSEEQSTRDQLNESIGRLREQAALLDAARDAIFVRDLDHRITFWNQGAVRLYGWTAEEAIGRTSRELIYRDPHLFDQAHAEVWRVGHWAGELEHLNRDGRALIVDCRWQVLMDDDDQPFAVMCVNSDITEHKREQAKWYREQRMESLGTLAGGIAHDLNNVLTPILITSQLLAADEEDPHRQDLLASIQSSVKRGADMVRQVLSFARGEELQRSLVDVQGLIEQLHTFARSALPPSIHLQTTTSDDLWNVTGDSTQLLQVLMNLVTNARDAMAGEGTLTITTRNVTIDDVDDDSAVTGWVLMEVEDTGSGMETETIDKLFEPFFTTKPLGSGTGLGLSTSLAITRGHGGDIDVYSERGTGTVFRARIPAALPGGSAAAVVPNGPSRAELQGHSELVLIVDDESTIRGIVQQILEKNGYRTMSASSGIEAIDVLKSTEPAVDVVLTDMMMPGMDGAATAAYLYEHHPDIPVIAASGLNANNATARAANPGAKHFLAKPFSTTELLTALHNALHEADLTT